MHVAMLSGGKDSLHVAFKSWPVDLGLLLVYEFPRPSPHLVNLGKCVETVPATRIPVVVLKLRKGRERDETVGLLSSLGADEVGCQRCVYRGSPEVHGGPSRGCGGQAPRTVSP